MMPKLPICSIYLSQSFATQSATALAFSPKREPARNILQRRACHNSQPCLPCRVVRTARGADFRVVSRLLVHVSACHDMIRRIPLSHADPRAPAGAHRRFDQQPFVERKILMFCSSNHRHDTGNRRTRREGGGDRARGKWELVQKKVSPVPHV